MHLIQVPLYEFRLLLREFFLLLFVPFIDVFWLSLQMRKKKLQRRKDRLHVMIYCQNGYGGEWGFTLVYE